MDVKVNLEEHLNKEIYIEVPNYIEDIEDYVYKIVKGMYKNGEIVLTSNDYNGVTLMSIEDSEYFEL